MSECAHDAGTVASPWSILLDDNLFAITQHLPAPRHYFALARVNRHCAALLATPRFFDDERVYIYLQIRRFFSLRGVTSSDIPRCVSHSLDLCLAVVSHRNFHVDHVTPELRTYEMWFAVVSKKSRALQQVPAEMRTQSLCTAAVERDGITAMPEVPERFRTYELWLRASTRSGSLASVPVHMRTPELLLAVVSSGRTRSDILEEIPLALRTHELLLALVTANPEMLRHLPKAERTPAICLAAVARHGEILRCLDADECTPELYLAAVTNDGHAIWHVPREARTREICLAAARHVPGRELMHYVPDKEQTDELLRILYNKF